MGPCAHGLEDWALGPIWALYLALVPLYGRAVALLSLLWALLSLSSKVDMGACNCWIPTLSCLFQTLKYSAVRALRSKGNALESDIAADV